MAQKQKAPPPAAAAVKEQFTIQKIYTKDLSFETPNSPQIFRKQWKPEVEMDVSNETTELGNGMFDVVLSVTVTVRVEGAVAYLAEVQQAGVFLIREMPEKTVQYLLATTCAGILFPFARELIAELVSRAGFPQFLIQPINFDALYKRRQEREMSAQGQQKPVIN